MSGRDKYSSSRLISIAYQYPYIPVIRTGVSTKHLKCLTMGVVMKKFYGLSLTVFLCLFSRQALAWGFKGHEAVNRVALSMLANPQAKKFMELNHTQVVAFSNTPDTKWKSGDAREMERPMHWFEMDSYRNNRFGASLTDLPFVKAEEELGKDYVNKYGLAIWRVSDFYQQLIASLKAKDFKLAVQVAGVMGHYVGDMTQPMHATSDYDGQSINKPGVHKYYETTLVDQIDADHLFDTLQKFAGERRSGLESSLSHDLSSWDVQKIIWTEATDSFAAVEGVYKRYNQETPEDQWLKGDLTPRIARAAALLGKIWDSAFHAAAASDFPDVSVDAAEPEWMPISR